MDLGLHLGTLTKLYCVGWTFVILFHSIIQPTFFKKWEFLPLMFYSVYGGIGCIICWFKCYQLYVESEKSIFAEDIDD